MTESRELPFDGRHIAVAGLVITAFIIRVHGLDAQSIWWDEAISIHLARSGVGEIVANRAANLHPPLYFFLLRLWRFFAGDSAFSVRFLSVWLGVPLIPGLYVFGRRWLTWRSGLIAAALATFSPLYLAYAQEARVYALLPVIYLILLALKLRLSQRSHRAGWSAWMLLAGVETLALGLHYVSLFAVGYVVLALFIKLRNHRPSLSRFLVAQGVVILLLTPWLLAVLGQLGAIARRLPRGNWGVEPVNLMHFVRLLWTFQMTGLAGLIADPLVVGLTTLTALVLFGALIHLLIRSSSTRGRSTTARLLLDWLIPLASAFAVWRIRPLSHPRYVIMFTPALLLTSAYVLDRLLNEQLLQQVGAALLAVSFLGTSFLGLHVYRTQFEKDDARGAAQAIEARSTADDVVLVQPEDWSIPYYYDGPAHVNMMPSSDAPSEWRALEELTEGAGTVFLVGYTHGTRERGSIIPFALEAAGSLVERWESGGIYVQVYDLDHAVTLPDLAPVDTRFDPLRLTGAWMEEAPPANTAVSIALRWQLEGPSDARLRATIRIQDEDGWTWASADHWLLDDSGLTTDEWRVEEEVTMYHILPLPPGMPLLTYTLSVAVYRMDGDTDTVQPLDLLGEGGDRLGRSFDVGDLSLSAPPRALGDPYGQMDRAPMWESPREFEVGLVLRGAWLDRQTITPGQLVFATMSWEKKGPLPADLHATLEMEREGETLLTETRPVGGRYPVQHWAIDQMVVEHLALTIPADVEDGPVQIFVRVGSERGRIGALGIEGGERRFTAPSMLHRLDVRFGDVAELLGYDLPQAEFAPGEAIPVVLYWRALDEAAAADYKVFTHLLDPDDHLLGQHDGRAAGGSRPTGGWVPGEVITDSHEITLDEHYTGPARLAVGLYDAATLERVAVADGGTSVLLPSPLSVSEQ